MLVCALRPRSPGTHPAKPFYRPTDGQAIACGVLNGEVVYKSKFKLQRFNDLMATLRRITRMAASPNSWRVLFCKPSKKDRLSILAG